MPAVPKANTHCQTPEIMSRSLLICLLLFVTILAGWSVELRPDEGTVLFNEIHENDRLALQALWVRTEGVQWRNDDNWIRGGLGMWHGVTVVNGRVTRLELPENNMSIEVGFVNSIPPEIGNLTHLEVLDLRGNVLRGAIPEEILQLTRLRELHLQGNQFRELPDLSPLRDHALIEVNVEDNFFTFEDLEPNVDQGFAITYAPQKEFTIQSVSRVAYEGRRVTLNAGVDGANNQYQWYLSEIPLEGATRSSYAIDPVSEANVGPYTVEVTNPMVPGLTLNSRLLRLEFIKRYSLQWLDIGAYHHAYADVGGRQGASVDGAAGMEYPAILRHSGHLRSQGFWIGVQNWTDAEGWNYPYYVARVGPAPSFDIPVSTYAAPIQNTLTGRYEDTVVEVNGEFSFDNDAVLDEIDPGLAADRMVHNVINMSMGITVDRKIYAYTNEFHDDYHIIDQTYCNTGNIDADEEIELPDQTLEDVFIFRSHAWRGSEQGAWATTGAQAWGRYSTFDVVGDGNREYPVDFTAQYGWIGWSIASLSKGYDDLGAPLFIASHETIAPGDTFGRLAGATMVGRSTIHADRSTTDPSYDRGQPSIMSYISNDNPIVASDRQTHEAYYRLGIVGPTLGYEESFCIPCRRVFPHFADRNHRGGEFWTNEDNSIQLTGALAGGFAATTGFGPYTMAPGECINITESEGIGGLSFDAATKIGQAFKDGGDERNTMSIRYDANSDGLIDSTAFDYREVFVGTELQTKNQWVMSARDSLFQSFYRARDVFEVSQGMTTYPIVEPPRAPVKFVLRSRPPDGIALEWTPATEGPAITQWELFRTEGREDNLYVNGCLEDPSIRCGYERIATLSPETTSYVDTDVAPETEYYYYIQALGESQSVDPEAMTGTPGGVALRSSRYLTQTYLPISTMSTVVEEVERPEQITLVRNFPNPFVEETTIRYLTPASAEVSLRVYDILGREVETLVNEFQGAGAYEVVFKPEGLASGVYVYMLRAGDLVEEGTMLLVK